VWKSKVVGAPGGWKNALKGNYNESFNPSAFSQTWEVLPPDKVSYGYIDYEVRRTLWEKEHNGFSWDKYTFMEPLLSNLDQPLSFWKVIFDWNTAFMKAYIEKELDFFGRFRFEGQEQVIDHLEQVKSKLTGSDGNSTIIRLGWGMGFHAITGDWHYEDHLPLKAPVNGRTWYKTRRIFFKEGRPFVFYLPGFIRLELLEFREGEEAFKKHVERLTISSEKGEREEKDEGKEIEVKPSREPEPYHGKIKRGGRCQAKVIGDALVLIRLQKDDEIIEVQATLKGYGGQLPEGTLVEVEFIQDNQIESVRYKRKLS